VSELKEDIDTIKSNVKEEVKKDEQKITINDDFILGQGKSLYDSARTLHDIMLTRMSKDMDLYDGKFSAEERKWSDYLGAPRLFIPKTYTNIQRIAVDIIEAFFFDPEEICGVQSYKSLPENTKQAVKAILNYRLNSHPIDFYKELYEGVIDAIKTTYCVFKVYPRIKTKKIKEQIPEQVVLLDGTVVDYAIEKEREVVDKYEPRFECIPPEDILFSPKATWKDYYSHPIIHKYKRTKDQLKKMGYKNVDSFGQIQNSPGSDSVKYQRDIDYGSPFKTSSNVRAQDEIWVYEVWDFLPYEDEGLQSCSYILLGDAMGPSVVGRGWEENSLPYKFSEFEYNRPPFVLGEAYPEPHRLRGKSYPQITESLQQETNAQRNQEREAVARDLRKTVYINREANVDLMSLTQRRIGGYVIGDGPADQAIHEIPSSNSSLVGAHSQARTDQDYYENGLPPNLLGSSSNDGTATGETQQLANANKKIAFVLKNIAYTGILPALQLLLRLEQTYASDEFINMVTGRTLGWESGDDDMPAKDLIQGDFDLSVNIGVNKQAQMNKYLLLLDRMNQYNASMAQLVQLQIVPIQEAMFANPTKVFDLILPIMGHKNVEEFKLQAQPPVPKEGGVPGVASQTGNIQDAGSSISQMSPMAPGVI
jgi:hypothetical protein